MNKREKIKQRSSSGMKSHVSQVWAKTRVMILLKSNPERPVDDIVEVGWKEADMPSSPDRRS